MDYVPDSALLSELTIPGTHDSGAMHEPWPGTAKCQNLTIAQQLDSGVRYLDIRLRHYEDSLVVHHGSVYQHMNFDDVLTMVTAFLAAHPSETVIMQVKEEYDPHNNTRSFEQTFNSYANAPAYSSYWWRHSYIPTLGEVRGRIVLLRRFSGSFWVSGGIDVTNWADNARFTRYDTRSHAIEVQDYYNVNASTNDNKIREIGGMLNDAQADSAGSLFLNFTSGVKPVWGVPSIPAVSGDVNNWLRHYFDNVAASNAHHGVVISDFITADLVRAELRAYFY
ncbi:phosphatidylinositol-specific phospholipase C [Microbulbifer sp.]|uniref:phosphatidylinositol-specific phospholipase C n=1 Tax=Microbulbifer sp. TaxID=1908541 RepID=UPI003F405DBE